MRQHSIALLAGLTLIIASTARAQVTNPTYTTTQDIPAGSTVTLTVGTPAPTPTPAGSISLVGFASPAYENAANANVTANEPSGIANGDYCVYGEMAYGNSPSVTPSGLTKLNSAPIGSASGTALNVYVGAYNGSAPTFDSISYAKVLTRCYSGVAGVDQLGGTNTSTVPALANTATAGEIYIGMMFTGNTTNAMSNTTGDLGNIQADQSQWSSFMGDKTLGGAGSTVSSESYSVSGGNNYTGFGLTLEP
jgi:hypothetical protein